MVLMRGPVRKIPLTIGSGALDDGNTSKTSVLRAGKPIAKKTADGKFYECDMTKSDGTEVFICVLGEEVNLNAPDGTVEDKVSFGYYAGDVNHSLAIWRSDSGFNLSLAKAQQPGLIWLTPPGLYFQGA